MSNNTQHNDWFKLKIEIVLKSCFSKSPPIYIFLATIIAVVFFGQQPNLLTCDVKIKPPIDCVDYNRAEYERLQPGMSRVEVEAILGRGIEIERSHNISTFKWENVDGSSITVIFENENLLSKHQLDL